MTIVADRSALYYPHIHIRDPHWLKQTLLCFPQVRRMIPLHYPLHDLPEIQKFRDLRGPHGDALLGEEDVYGYHVYEAQSRLADKLLVQPEEALLRFNREAALRRYGRVDSFQIHRGKFMGVLEFLRERNLAWDPVTENRADWVAVHPQLGTAIMSFIAIGIADAKGLDIVTGSGSTHLAVSTHDEALVFEELMKGRWVSLPQKVVDRTSEKTDELVQVVIRSCFDVSKLSPQQIADLVNDGKDLRAFKNALVPLAQSIPDITDEGERKKRFDSAAAEVIGMWSAYKKSLPRFAVDALLNTANVNAPDLVGTVATTLGGHHLMGVGGALFFGVFAYSGLGVYREWKEKVNSPLRYLTKIRKAGAVFTVSR